MNREGLRFDVNGTTIDWLWILVDVSRYGALLAWGIALGISWQADQLLGTFCGGIVTQPPQCGPLLAATESMVLQLSVLGGVLLVGSFLLPLLDGGDIDE